MTADLISTLTRTPKVLDSEYPWTLDDLPSRDTLVECFADGQPHNMSLGIARGFKLNDLPVELKMAYRIIKSCIHPIDSKDPITYDWSLCLYAVWTHTSIDFGTVAMAIMKMMPFGKPVLLPFGSLITQIAKHHGISTEGMIM